MSGSSLSGIAASSFASTSNRSESSQAGAANYAQIVDLVCSRQKLLRRYTLRHPAPWAFFIAETVDQ